MVAPKTLLETHASGGRSVRSASQTLIVIAAVLLLFLPFVTTFNEFLTAVVLQLGLDRVLRDWVVPLEARMMVVLIRPLGLQTIIVGDTLHLYAGGRGVPIYISWNCVGWQSLVLLGITLAAGLQGDYTPLSKLTSVAVGLLGTFLVNIVRLVSVALVAAAGHPPLRPAAHLHAAGPGPLADPVGRLRADRGLCRR